MSIVNLQDVSLTLAGNCILSHVDWQIPQKARIALVGRNGAGKSTLLSLLNGDMTPDSGKIHTRSNLRVAGLTQHVPTNNDETVYHFLVKDLGALGECLLEYRRLNAAEKYEEMADCQQQMDALHGWEAASRVENIATQLQLDVDAHMESLSGGMRRRAMLAGALIAEPDLLLLDEPTNHLDLITIEWLESYLKNFAGSVCVVTHDRVFLAQVANQIVEIDRGNLRRYDCNFETYLARREGVRLSEEKHNALFDKRLSDEEVWIRKGIQARRTRNEGRVRALKAMRVAHAERRLALAKVKTVTLDVAQSGQLVIEATDVCYNLDNGVSLLADFSFLLTRGDKVGIVGPNGCGKTTLVKLLLGEIAPSSGKIRLGTGLNVAYFDQLRRQLDERQTVLENVADGADFVTILGKQKHVASYLRDFLFSPERFQQPVSVLSGGERNRLLLAKLFARPVNLLVMDEPTNDLDIETLELLESMLNDYTGTLLLISHDREFINNVVTSVLIHEGERGFQEYVGGYDDYRAKIRKEAPPKQVIAAPVSRKNVPKITYNEQRELSQLPVKIEKLEKKLEEWQIEMASGEFYQLKPEAQRVVQQKYAKHEQELADYYARWEVLEAKK